MIVLNLALKARTRGIVAGRVHSTKAPLSSPRSRGKTVFRNPVFTNSVASPPCRDVSETDPRPCNGATKGKEKEEKEATEGGGRVGRTGIARIM